MSESRQKTCLVRNTKLETANAMYKAAFSIKKHKFTLQQPKLSESEIYELTVRYFQNLPKD